MSAERVKLTEADIAAWLLRMKRSAGWANSPLPCVGGPLRDAARKAGLVEVRRLNKTHGPYRTYLTEKGRQSLIDIPGSGIYSHAAPDGYLTDRS